MQHKLSNFTDSKTKLHSISAGEHHSIAIFASTPDLVGLPSPTFDSSSFSLRTPGNALHSPRSKYMETLDSNILVPESPRATIWTLEEFLCAQQSSSSIPQYLHHKQNETHRSKTQNKHSQLFNERVQPSSRSSTSRHEKSSTRPPLHPQINRSSFDVSISQSAQNFVARAAAAIRPLSPAKFRLSNQEQLTLNSK